MPWETRESVGCWRQSRMKCTSVTFASSKPKRQKGEGPDYVTLSHLRLTFTCVLKKFAQNRSGFVVFRDAPQSRDKFHFLAKGSSSEEGGVAGLVDERSGCL